MKRRAKGATRKLSESQWQRKAPHFFSISYHFVLNLFSIFGFISILFLRYILTFIFLPFFFLLSFMCISFLFLPVFSLFLFFHIFIFHGSSARHWRDTGAACHHQGQSALQQR